MRVEEPESMDRCLIAGVQGSERFSRKSEIYGFSGRKITVSAKIPEPSGVLSWGLNRSTRTEETKRMDRCSIAGDECSERFCKESDFFGFLAEKSLFSPKVDNHQSD